jgi:predicted metalloprotease with PDZ domain
VDEYMAMIRRVVEEQHAVFGELPRFEPGHYTFIADYLPWVSGDGMEHRNSTILTANASLSVAASGLLGAVSHEFFHAWNVERLRPRSLEPFDFDRANISGELWLAEGFTEYYGPMLIRRAGLSDDRGYAREIGGVIDEIVNSPGRRFFSPVEMSQQAAFVDAATSIDAHNRQNTFISYYTWGAGIGLALDLTLRDRFRLSLDEYMRALWVRYGRQERPYTLADLRVTLGEVTRDQAFADDFFRRYVEGREAPDYAALLARAGFLVRRQDAGRAWIGSAPLRFGDGATVLAQTLVGTPLYDSGIDRGDRILSLDGRPLTSEGALSALLAARRPGDVVAVEYESRGQRRSGRLTLAEDPALEVVTYEEAARPLTTEIRAFRQSWLGAKAATP